MDNALEELQALTSLLGRAVFSRIRVQPVLTQVPASDGGADYS